MSAIRPKPASSALVIIDVQDKLLAAMPNDAQERVLRVCNQLVTGASALAVPVFLTEQYPKGLGHTAEALEPHLHGAGVGPERRFEKTHFSAMDVPEFRSALDGGYTDVFVVGMEAHICVHQTVRDLCEAGYRTHVVSDGTCSRQDEHRRIAEGLWTRSGASVTCGEAVLFDWLGKAGGDAFKAISRAIR